jgi:hypothetical protein
MELITNACGAEPEYTKAFLLTHHAFTNSKVVLNYLLKMYVYNIKHLMVTTI